MGVSGTELEEVTELLGSIPLLQHLPATSVHKVAQVIEPVHFGPGDLIVRAGDVGQGVYIIWKGTAQALPATVVDGQGYIGPPLKRGDYFGVAAGPIVVHHKVDVEAVTEVTCLVVPHKYGELLCSHSNWKGREGEQGQSAIEEILQLESIETDYFRAVTSKRQRNYGQVFGGQLIGQALVAATKSVDPALFVHSLHSYFLRRGDKNLPILYKVTRTRDGQTYATRQVSAIQKGVVIFNMQASFQRPEEGIAYQMPMPEAPDPEQLLSVEALKASHKTDPRLSNHAKRNVGTDVLGPIDLRLIDPMDYIDPRPKNSRNSMWLRSRSKLSNDPAFHACVLAYASDMELLDTILRPLGLRIGKDGFLLSLDHSMWFHKPFRADEWLLMVADAVVTAGGRGFAQGHIYTRSGELVLSVAQEGVVRITKHMAKL